MMRVLHIIPSLDPESGGPARSVPALCNALAAAGADVSLYSFGARGAPTTTTCEASLVDTRVLIPFWGTKQVPTPTFFRRLSQELPAFDLVHINSVWNMASTMTALVARRARVPYVISPRGMLQSVSVGRRGVRKRVLFALWEKRTLQNAAAIHFLGQTEAADSAAFVSRVPSFVLPSGIEADLEKSVVRGQFRRRHPQLADKKIMLFMGRLHWSKGLEVQLEALHTLSRTHPDLVWVLVGPDGGAWPDLSKRIKALGLEDRVVATGFLDGAERLEALIDADVFVLTSRHEAHSMAMNEALALGVPLVLTDSVQFDLARDRGAAVVVPRDPEALATGLARVLDDAGLAAQLRIAGRRLIEHDLSWSRIATEMLGHYESVLRASNPIQPVGSR